MNSAITRVANALLIDYTSVYYIDLNTNHYECYSTNTGYQKLELQISGEDFFADCIRDIRNVVYEEDWDMLSNALTREALLQQFRERDEVSIVYRLLIDGQPVYHSMRIFRDAAGEEDCMILGVLNVDESIRSQQATATYNAIAKTLADRYATIYYVDLDTEHYVEYSSNSYKDLKILPEGDDFFESSRKNILQVIHPEDQEKVLAVFDREFMIKATDEGRKFQIEYRLIINEISHHVSLSAVQTDNQEHLIITLDNIDLEIRNQEEMKAISDRSIIFTHIAESLANQYGMIYYIDAETDEYIEFTRDELQELFERSKARR